MGKLLCALMIVVATHGAAWAAEDWFCAYNDNRSVPSLDQLRVDGAMLKNITQDSLLRMYLPKDAPGFYGEGAPILVNNEVALMAHADSAAVTTEGKTELYSVSVYIEKQTGAFWRLEWLVNDRLATPTPQMGRCVQKSN